MRKGKGKSMKTKLSLLAIVMTILSGCHAHFPALRTDTASLQQHEITQSGLLLDSKGNLAEPGWARQPLPQFAKDAVQGDSDQLRQWDYYAILSPDLLIEVTVANVRFASFCSVLVSDIRNKKKTKQILASRGKMKHHKVIGELPENQHDRVSCVGGDQQEILSITKRGNQRIFDINMPKAPFSKAVSGQIVLYEEPGNDSFVGVFPFTEIEKGFFYENKVPGLPATGHVIANGTRYDIPVGAFAVRDWGRGTWPKKLVWQWGMAGGRVGDKRVDFNLGAGFGDISRGTENIVFVDGVGHKLGFVNWEFDRKDPGKSWTLKDPEGRFEARLRPVHLAPISANLIVKGVKIYKAYGYFDGFVTLDDGSKLMFNDLFGFTEEVYIRW